MNSGLEAHYENKLRYVGLIGDKQWFLKHNLIPNNFMGIEQLNKNLPIFDKLSKNLIIKKEGLEFILDFEKNFLYIILSYPYSSSQMDLKNQNFNSFIHKLDKAYTRALSLLFIFTNEVWINYKPEGFASLLRHMGKASEVKKKHKELQYKSPFIHFIFILDKFKGQNEEEMNEIFNNKIESFKNSINIILKENKIVSKQEHIDTRSHLAQLPSDFVETIINEIQLPELYDLEEENCLDSNRNTFNLHSLTKDINNIQHNKNTIFVPKDSQKSMTLNAWMERVRLNLSKLS